MIEKASNACKGLFFSLTIFIAYHWERVKKKWDNVFKTCMDVWEDKIEDLKKKGKAVLNTIEKEATKVWNKVERSPWFQVSLFLCFQQCISTSIS